MVDDFNNSDGGPSMTQHLSFIFYFLFFAKEMPKGEIVGDICCHNLRQNCGHVPVV